MAEVKLILQTLGFPWHIVALEEVGGPVSDKRPWRVGSWGVREGPVESRHAEVGWALRCPPAPEGVWSVAVGAALLCPGACGGRGDLQGGCG